MSDNSFMDYKNGSGKLRVAAYVRVATSDEETSTKFQAQMRFYTEYIESRQDWEFAGLYGDEGVTGLTTEERYSFLKMMQDARDGKIDLIMVKSISRFARNMTTLLDVVRELNSLGVGVYFETENLCTLDEGCEKFFSIVSSFVAKQRRTTGGTCNE